MREIPHLANPPTLYFRKPQLEGSDLDLEVAETERNVIDGPRKGVLGHRGWWQPLSIPALTPVSESALAMA